MTSGQRVFVVLLLLASVLCAQRPAPESLAQRDTVAFIKITEPAALGPFLDGSHPLYKIPTLASLLNENGIDPKSLGEMATQALGVSIQEIAECLDGPVACWFKKGDSGFLDMKTCLAIGVKTDEKSTATLKTLIAKAKQAIGEELGEEGTEVIGDVEVETFKQEARGQMKESLVYFVSFAGHLLLSNDREYFEHALARLREKEAPSLDGKESYQASMKRLEPATAATFFMDVSQLLGDLAKDLPADADTSKRAMDAVGLTPVQAVAFGIGKTEEALEMITYVHAPGKRKGLLKLLSPNTGPLTLDRIATADATSTAIVYLDIPNLLQEVRAIAEAIDSSNVEKFDAAIGMLSSEMGIDLQKDLLAHLIPPITFVDFPKEKESDPAAPAVIAWNSTGGKQVLASIQKLAEAAGMEFESTDYMGTKVHSLPLPMLGSDSEELLPAIAVTDSHIFFSLSGPKGIERVLRMAGKPAAPITGTPEYQRAMAGIPKNAWYQQFMRVESLVDNIMSAISMLGEMAELPKSLMKLKGRDVAAFVDFIGLSIFSDAGGMQVRLRGTLPPKSK